MDKSEPIRVLCVFSRTDIGGAESFCMNVYRNLDRSKVQFDFVKHTKDACDFDKEIQQLGGRIFIAPRYKGYNRLSYRKWWRQFFLAHPEYKIVHGHYFTVAYEYLDLARKMGRYTIVHSHGVWKSNFFEVFLKRWVEKSADYCMACSKKAGEWLFPNRDFEVLHNGIKVDNFLFDEEKRKDKRTEIGINDDALVVGTIANFSEPKNPFGLIEIFSTLLERNPNAVLLWIGYGYMEREIRKKISDEGLCDRVILAGKTTDVIPFLMAMDVFLLPSFAEGLSVALIEAQAAGLPCICSDSIAREVDITEQCTFVSLGGKEEWADQIIEMSQCIRSDNSEQIRKAGYAITDVAGRMQDFYLKVSDDRKYT